MKSLTVSTPLGELLLTEENGALTTLSFAGGGEDAPQSRRTEETPLLCRAQAELLEYFAGTRRVFDLPLSPRGTAFDHRVWAALQTIPYGERCTYGQLAQQLGNPRACRAVGMANHRNPLPILIPCHRCGGVGGRLTGYAGGLARKQFLLELEAR
jgi:methylated-DNA-[protein]-cysteine S-methyltransferase